MSKENRKSDYVKNDKIDFKKVNKDIRIAVLMMSVLNLLIKSIRWIEFIAYAIVGAGWMVLLMVFIWTGNLFLLKILVTPIVAALILMCIVEGIKALRKNREGTLDLINKDEKKEYQMSKEDFLHLQNSLNSFNDYERNVKNIKSEKPTYQEFKNYAIELKPQLFAHENLIKVWYGMFEGSKWTIAGFNIRDWKLSLKRLIETSVNEQLDNYINFYTI